MSKKIQVTYAGGALSVTGANFLVEGFEKTFLIDCGFEQGSKMAEESNWDPFVYDAKQVDTLFVTHAHLDHIGLIPKLVYEGFQGKIISTPATRDIAKHMLEDTVGILSSSESGKEFNLKEIYNEKILHKIFSMWEVQDYHQPMNVGSDLTVEFFDAGHILGSAFLVFEYNKQKFVFSGDLGNSPSPLLRDTEPLPKDVKYLLMESVYGDRNHEGREHRRDKLQKILQENYDKKGTLVVPVFSLERSQEFVYEINNLVEDGLVPRMPIYLDSPLALKVTEVFDTYTHLFKEGVKKEIREGDDIFAFPGFRESLKTAESKAIAKVPGPKVILAGSGMSTGGRVLHHEKRYLSDPNNTVLITGFQTPGSLGRLLQEGTKKVVIFDEEVVVKARVESIFGYSGHRDSDHLVEFVSSALGTLKKVVVTMGEMKSSMYLAQRLHDELGVSAHVPQPGSVDVWEFDD